MLSTKHCCWGKFKLNSRYPDEWPKSLRELKESGKEVFIPFPKPSKDIEKCKRWLVACYCCASRFPAGCPAQTFFFGHAHSWPLM